MPDDRLYPSAAQLTLVERDLIPQIQANRPVFDVFPIVNSPQSVLMWEQQDNYRGLQQLRGMNGAPTSIKRQGAKRYTEVPGIYGEYIPIDELEITTRRGFGDFATPIDVRDLVLDGQQQLLGRRYERIESILWTLLAYGTFSVASPTGGIIHTDSYTTQTYAAIVPWATVSTAMPINDFRLAKLKARGHSVAFDKTSQAYMNAQTANYMWSNRNPADLYGIRGAGYSTLNAPDVVGSYLQGEDLPIPVVYDGGYYDDSGVFQLFIPDNVVVLVGRRTDGGRVGEYRMTRNANNPGEAPGPYTRVIDPPDRIPRSMEVHDGHNGGPVLYFPSAIVVMSV